VRVARIPYLHCDPFYFDMTRRGLELCELAPSVVAAAAEQGEIDAGPVPLVDYFRLEDRFQLVGGFGVASLKRAGSVLLFSAKPIADLHGSRIGVTAEAATALRLLQVLLRLKYGVRGEVYESLDASPDAFLLIGNEGLRRRLGVRGFPYTYDLGAEWYAWTGLPFVFSRWVVRQDADPKAKALLQDTLYVGLEEGVNALFAVSKPREDLLMLPRDIVAHIQGLRYHLGMAEHKAIDRFRQCLAEL
jgi:chorismate dehydratase